MDPTSNIWLYFNIF